MWTKKWRINELYCRLIDLLVQEEEAPRASNYDVVMDDWRQKEKELHEVRGRIRAAEKNIQYVLFG